MNRPKLAWAMIAYTTAALCFVCSSAASSQSSPMASPRNPLIGGTGVSGPPTLDGLRLNPAQAADISRSGLSAPLDLNYRVYKRRYPGFPAREQSGFTLDGVPIPTYVYKANRRFGFYGLIVPFPLGTTIDQVGVPVLVMGQENLVNLSGEGRLRFLADAAIGWRMNEDYSFGLAISFASFSGQIDARSSAGDPPLFSADADITIFDTTLGMKAKYRDLNLGVSVGLLQSGATSIAIRSEALDALKDGAGSMDSEKNNFDFLNPLRIGVSKRVRDRVLLRGEMKYERTAASKEFSLVDLTEKMKDTHDTVSVYVGGEYDLRPHETILAGYYYEPSPIGPGSPGVNGKAGFGVMDILSSLGQPPTYPGWALSIGYRKDFVKKKRKMSRQLRSQPLRPKRTQYGIEIGASYGETSIGIPADGEQPGAYLVRNIRFPFRFLVDF